MRRFCANVRACEIPVLELEDPQSKAGQRILEECRQALKEERLPSRNQKGEAAAGWQEYGKPMRQK